MNTRDVRVEWKEKAEILEATENALLYLFYLFVLYLYVSIANMCRSLHLHLVNFMNGNIRENGKRIFI